MGGKESNKTRGPKPLTKLYLLTYNLSQTIGWAYMLYQLITYYLIPNSESKLSLWETIWWSVMIFQNSAVLEIFHSMIGIVSSGVMVTFIQVFSRVYLVCGILLITKAAPASIGLPMAVLAWCITEIIRYGFYFTSLLGGVPKFLLFLRYTLFIGLYPLGITGELICMYYGQKEVGENQIWTYSMPNDYNFIFNYQYFIVIYMLLYIPFFPMLYGHMFTQRKKILGGSGDQKGQSKKTK